MTMLTLQSESDQNYLSRVMHALILSLNFKPSSVSSSHEMVFELQKMPDLYLDTPLSSIEIFSEVHQVSEGLLSTGISFRP